MTDIAHHSLLSVPHHFLHFSQSLVQMRGCHPPLSMHYVYNEKFTEAEELLLKALNIRKEILGDYSRELYDVYYLLANTYVEMGNQDDSEKYYVLAMEVAEKVFDQRDNMKMANLYHNVGAWYADQKKYCLAETYFLQAIELRKKLPESVATARTFYRTGIMYQYLFDKINAEKYLRKAYHIYLKNFGEEYEETLMVKEKLDSILSSCKV